MTQLDRLELALTATALAAFAVFGSAVPNFSDPFPRAVSAWFAAMAAWLAFTRPPRRRVAVAGVFGLAAFLVLRGFAAWGFGGTQRFGVMVLHLAWAVGVASAAATWAATESPRAAP